jgi:endonuclease G
MKSTFIMTNVCPQVPALNRGAWKRMEDNCRNLVKKGVQLAVHVDAVFWHADTQRIGMHGVAVPHGFVKTVRDVLTDTICYSKYFQNW